MGWPHPAEGWFCAVQPVGVGAVVPPSGPTATKFVTFVPPIEAFGLTVMLMTGAMPPLIAIVPPPKVQVTVPTVALADDGVQVQFVPVAETKSMPLGTA